MKFKFSAITMLFFASIACAQEIRFSTSKIQCLVRPDGRLEIIDVAGGVTWRTAPTASRFAEVALNDNGRKRTVGLEKPSAKPADGGVDLTFTPVTGTTVTVHLRAKDDTLALSYSSAGNAQIERIRLLDSLSLSGGDYALIPAREGLLVPANSGIAFTQSFDSSTYEGCHMMMTGLVQDGAAALVTWPDFYTSIELKNDKQTLAASINLRKTATTFTFRFLGKGDWNTIATAYRTSLQRITLEQKIQQNNERAKLLGASNVKLWSALSRRMNDESTREEAVHVNWTFAEAAQVAKHLHDDLKMEKVLFTIGGWIHRGYDNQHPDVLPAAPECGGDAELAKCAKEVMGLGYLFCLHDNVQDIYKDSLSWDEKWIARNPNGDLVKGGKWAGGRAYITCAKMAVELAKRPQNLPAVKKLTNANSYFIDTTYAAGLQECFSKDHPLDRAGDLREKCNLSDYAREVFGVFGSECGREWALPHSDFFEGLTGVSGTYYHNLKPQALGATVIPLFELVHRDSIAMYGKYGYDIRSAGEYVLHHVSIGRPLNYHNVPAHLYWKSAAEERVIVPAVPTALDFKQTSPRQFTIAYEWNVTGKIDLDWRIFGHFVTGKKIAFQNDYDPKPATSQWSPGVIKHGPFTVRVPQDAAGVYELRVGMWKDNARATLKNADKEYRVLLGRVKVTGDKIEFEPASETRPTIDGDRAMYVRADNGWAAGMHPFDRFMKNTHEVLSPLNELTAKLTMTKFEFVTADKGIRRSTFGQGEQAVIVTTNFSNAPWKTANKQGGQVVLPPLGFMVESPGFTAFCATMWDGIAYDTPTLFTLRNTHKGIQIFHAFGQPALKIGNQLISVERELLLPPSR